MKGNIQKTKITCVAFICNNTERLGNTSDQIFKHCGKKLQQEYKLYNYHNESNNNNNNSLNIV